MKAKKEPSADAGHSKQLKTTSHRKSGDTDFSNDQTQRVQQQIAEMQAQMAMQQRQIQQQSIQLQQQQRHSDQGHQHRAGPFLGHFGQPPGTPQPGNDPQQQAFQSPSASSMGFPYQGAGQYSQLQQRMQQSPQQQSHSQQQQQFGPSASGPSFALGSQSLDAGFSNGGMRSFATGTNSAADGTNGQVPFKNAELDALVAAYMNQSESSGTGAMRQPVNAGSGYTIGSRNPFAGQLEGNAAAAVYGQIGLGTDTPWARSIGGGDDATRSGGIALQQQQQQQQQQQLQILQQQQMQLQIMQMQQQQQQQQQQRIDDVSSGTSGSSRSRPPSGLGPPAMQSGGYEGDGSNLSSSATPGGTSSGDDGSGKRRRMTFGGSGINSSTNASSSLAALPHQPASARLPPSDYVGSMGPPQLTAQPSQRSSQVAGQTQQKSPITPATARSLAASASAAATAAESSHAALARHRRVYSGDVHGSGGPILTSENNHGSPTGGDHAMDAHLGDLSNISPHNAFSRSTSFATQNTPSWLASGSRPVLNTSGSIGGPAHPSIQGHAASHPPGLGSQVLRGPDRASIGHNAATDFTRRKGWSARVVEELLDMVHVLDDEARFLYATPGIFQMTGWRAEELRGMPLWNYVHPEDVEDVKREFARMSTGKADMTCYYRFRRKPQTAADKRQKRADIELATGAGDSPSTSGVDSRGDSSSAEPASQRGPNRARRGASSTGSPDEDDTEEHWEIFETTGHAYVPPKPLQIDANGELNHDEIDKMLTDNLGEDGATSETNAGEKAGAGAQESPSSSSKVQYYFCSARVYPTKNVAMLDSFLELKLENERLRLLLADMDLKDGERMARRSSSRYNASEGHLDERKSGTDGQSQGRASLDDAAYHPDFFYKAELEAAADHRRESASSMNGAAWRRESGSDFAGHKSQPTSPPLGSNTIGNTPSSTMQRTLTSGTGVAEESEEDDDGDLGGTEDGSRKKKKPKGDEGDYVCTDCGRIDSPEWRKGPLGPKTLCNACGLRWAKKVKRSGGDPTAISNAAAKTPSKKSQAAAARAAAHAHRHAHQSTGIDIGMGVLMGQASQTATAHGAMNQIPAFMRDHSSQHLSTIQQHDMSPQHGTDLMNAHH